MENEEFKEMQAKFVEQFRSGQPLFGKEGVFGPLLKNFIEAALEAEMDVHLSPEARQKGNKRNGKGHKSLKTEFGTIDITTPEDRQSSFAPQIVKKRETVLADRIAPNIIGLYGKGMSFRDISSHIEELYDVSISHETLSEITDRIIPQVTEWQNRPLESLYPILWLDAMHYKVKDGGRVASRAVYNVLAINRFGQKELIGMYVSETEGANFWLSVLTDLKARGLEDILIACIDNLSGFAQAIQSVYPKVEIQSCVIHQVRNSLKYVASKNQKEFMGDLKNIYQAATKALAESALVQLENKWGEKYPVVIKSWQTNWEKLSTYFDYDPQIRKLIYTTNAVEGFHRQIRKITKTKGVFPNDQALKKLIYLAVLDISKKWTKPLQNWSLTVQQLRIRFGDRMQIDL